MLEVILIFKQQQSQCVFILCDKWEFSVPSVILQHILHLVWLICGQFSLYDREKLNIHEHTHECEMSRQCTNYTLKTHFWWGFMKFGMFPWREHSAAGKTNQPEWSLLSKNQNCRYKLIISHRKGRPYENYLIKLYNVYCFFTDSLWFKVSPLHCRALIKSWRLTDMLKWVDQYKPC